MNNRRSYSIVFIIIFAVWLVAFYQGICYQKSRIPHLRDFQKLIGCEKIDCKVGPCWLDSEVQHKWEAAYWKQHGKIMY